MLIIKQYLWVIACVLAVQAFGQVAPSPFTKFGIGENYSDALANTQGMAGVGVSHPQAWYINNQNPALLVYNTMATFQMGALGESRSIKNNLRSERNLGGNLNYLVIALPIKPLKWTSSVGLMPYTSVNYSYQETRIVDGNTTTYNSVSEGSGGITQLYWSNGVRLTKEFAIGAKISYLFGPITVIDKLQIPNSVISASEDKTVIKDFTLGFGGSFSKDSLWNDGYRVSIGAVYNLDNNLNASFTNKSAYMSSGGDTISSVLNPKLNGSIYVPPSITGGISFSKNNQWAVGTEFSYQDWTSFKNPGKGNEDLQRSWRTSIGGEYTPDPTATEGFLKRITYRVGYAAERCSYLVNGKPVKDAGVNFGFSFPSGRSSIDLAFKVGRRGNKAESTLEENYFKIFFGLTFNDQWFIRRKFD